MKKTTLWLSVLLFLFIFGCKKDEKLITNLNNVSYESTVSKIRSFQVRIANTYKSGETISLDSAIWYIEATLNYTYDDLDTAHLSFSLDSAFYDVKISNDSISLYELENAFSAFEDSLNHYYNSIYAIDKDVCMIDLEILHNNGLTANMKMTSGIAYGPGPNPPNAAPFGLNDYWKWWNGGTNNGGYCDGIYEGQQPESDAAEEIEKAVMQTLSFPTGSFFTAVENFEVLYPEDWPLPNNPTPNDNRCDYLLYKSMSGYPNFDGCLDPAEMNFYYFGILDIINSLKPASKTFHFLDMQGDAYFPGNESVYLHRAPVIKYGVLCVPPPGGGGSEE